MLKSSLSFRTLHFEGMPAFITIWLGQLISTMGSGLTGWGLGVLVYKQTDSTILFVLNLIFYILPTVIFAPIAGVVADRWDRRKVLIMADAGAGLGTFSALLVLMIFGELEVWHVYIVTAVAATANTFQWPAYGAAVPMLVPKEQLGRTGGMSQVGEALSQLVTPALAGALFVTVGMHGIVLIDICTMLFAIGTLLVVHIPMPELSKVQESKKDSFWQQMTFGWKYIAARPGLLGLLFYFAIANFISSIAFALFTPMMLDMTTPDMLGYVGSVGGVGMVIGTIVMSLWGGPINRRVYAILLSDIFGGLGMVLMGVRPLIPLIAAGNFIVMFILPIGNGNSDALWQTKVALDVQGRVFSVRRMIAFSIIPVAYLLAGALSERVVEPMMMESSHLASSLGPIIGIGPGRGIGLLFVVMGILWSLASLVAVLYPRIRRLEIELPDARPDVS
jgi:DHA3 family macrolide efflux protein-like MFS transporter